MFIDTNILVAARFVTAPAHVTACRCLDRIGNSGEALHISRRIVREFLVAVTRPQSSPAALSIDDALERLISSFTVLEDGPNVMAALVALCRGVSVAGKQIHDANIAATMLAHGERRLPTLNVKDFRRYGERIELVDLEAAACARIPESPNEPLRPSNASRRVWKRSASGSPPMSPNTCATDMARSGAITQAGHTGTNLEESWTSMPS